MSENYRPTYRADAFHCPRCKVLVPQNWYRIYKSKENSNQVYMKSIKDADLPRKSQVWNAFTGQRAREEWDLEISVCTRCENYTIWENENIIFPIETSLPEPHEDMFDDVKGIYREAMDVYKHSPRASAALLRLAIETMIPQLEEYQIKKAKINTMIGELVKKDIPEHIQQGLDAIRIYGNEGIHPGEIVLNDDGETVMFLFELINIMVEELITRKKKIRKFYGKLPFDKIRGIINRDKVKEDSK